MYLRLERDAIVVYSIEHDGKSAQCQCKYSILIELLFFGKFALCWWYAKPMASIVGRSECFDLNQICWCTHFRYILNKTFPTFRNARILFEFLLMRISSRFLCWKMHKNSDSFWVSGISLDIFSMRNIPKSLDRLNLSSGYALEHPYILVFFISFQAR